MPAPVAPTPVPEAAPLVAPVLPSPPAAEACKTLGDCAKEATQCLMSKLAAREDQSTDQRYYVEYAEGGIPQIKYYDVPSTQNHAEGADCGLELDLCLQRRC
jgi:hypothetical protein